MTTRIATVWKSTFRSAHRTLLVAGATVFAIAMTAGATGQQRPGQDIRVAQTASVDFMVVTKDGQPVPDMKAEELSLKVDGKIRPIKSLQYIRLSGPGGADATPAAPAVASAFATNQVMAAELPRSIILIVDDETMPIGQEVKIRNALNNFVKDLPPTDQVALVTVPHGGIKVGLTTDRERLRKEIAGITPINPIQDAPCRTIATLSTIESTLDMLTRSSEQPVTVALLSSALSGVSTVESSARPTSATTGGLSSQGGACAVKSDDFVRIGQAVASVRAQFYVIHPDYTQSAASDGIVNLQGQTNAPLYHLITNTEPGLSRMLKETSGYYVATFDTEPDELVGKPHPSSLATTRKEVVVHYRPYLVVGRANPAAHAVVPTTVVTADAMARSGKPYRDLPLRATASPFRADNGTLNVIIAWEPTDPSVKIMTAYAALIDEAGQARDIWPGQNEPLTTWPTSLGLHVKPGTYRVRIAAIDSNGRQGTVDDQVVAGLAQAGPVQVSGLLLGVQPGGKFTPRLQFSTEPEAIAYLEIYGATEGTQIAAYFEVSTTTNGAATSTVPGTFAPTGEEGKYGVTAKIPLASLAAGDYVIRAIVGVPGKPGARVIRTLHKAR